jgi:hypothetical protein
VRILAQEQARAAKIALNGMEKEYQIGAQRQALCSRDGMTVAFTADSRLRMAPASSGHSDAATLPAKRQMTAEKLS